MKQRMAKNRNGFSTGLLDKTIRLWQKKYATPLNCEDAREIIQNFTALFDLLNRLYDKYYEKDKKTQS